MEYQLQQTGQQVQDILNQAPTTEQNLQSEITRSTEKDQELESAIATEKQRAEGVESELQTAIGNEVSRAEGAEGNLQTAITNEKNRAEGVEDGLRTDVDGIESKIPTGASSENKLATEGFVNSSIATNTAEFKGTFPSLEALQTEVQDANQNDYGFVISTDSAGNTVYNRYKYVDGTGWVFEYALNNSSFTAAQWAAINSGITAVLVAKIAGLPTVAELTQQLNAIIASVATEKTRAEGAEAVLRQSISTNATAIVTEKNRAEAAEGTLTNGLNAEILARQNADTALQQNINAEALLRDNADDALQDEIDGINSKIPTQASASNQLADKAFVNSSIATNTGEFKGTYNSLAELQAVTNVNANDYGFVIATDGTGNTVYNRYKYVTGQGWQFEYALNNSSFTAAQWGAINSGITAALAAKINGLPDIDALNAMFASITSKIPANASSSNKLVDYAQLVAALAAKQDTLIFDNVPTENSNNPVKSGGVYSSIATVTAAVVGLQSSKQDVLTFDQYPTAGSDNPVRSTGIYSAIENAVSPKANQTDLDNAVIRISTNEVDIAQLQAAYRGLTQNDVVPVAPTDTWPVANPQENVIYRVADRTNTPPQYYTDYMWNGTVMVEMAQYDNAIDNYPTAGSNNLAKSGGIDAEIKSLVGYYTCGTAAATAAKTITANYYILLQGGSIKVKFTYKNTVDDATLKIGNADAKPLFYAGRRAGSSNSWEAGEVVDIFYDGTNYQAINVKGSNGDGVFDISAYHATGGTLATYADLSAALDSNNGGGVPQSLQKGGMSVKFVQTSDNKYVQARCMAQNFTTDVTQWQGVDDEPTAGSKNLVESGGIIAREENNGFYPSNENASFNIIDNNGNVIGKFDENGLSVTDVKVKSNSNLVSVLTLLADKVDKDGTKVLSDNNFTDELKEKIEGIDIFPDAYTNCLYVSDSNGNAILKIDANGIKSVAFIDKEGNNVSRKALEGYTLYSIGDSISAGGKWQQKISALTGISFDQSKNIDAQAPLSVGGTISGGSGFDNGIWRTKHLIDKGYITDEGEKEIVIIECVNDTNIIGKTGTFDKSAITIVPTDPIEGYNYADWGTSLLQSIDVVNRKMNACFRLLVTGQSGKNLAITNLPTVEGDIRLRITTGTFGAADYTIHVVPQATDAETLQYVLDRILEYNYAAVTDSLASDGESVDFVGYNISVSFTDIGNTGMTASITDTDNASSSRAMYFIGESISDWEDTSKWTDNVTFSIAYKSIIEMLQKNFPKLKIFIGIFPALADKPNDYLLPNGNYDTYTFYNSERMQKCRHLQEVLKGIAADYRIPAIDVFGLCGIGITNYSTYYLDNNVHPKDIGYERFGEVISSQLCNYIIK